MDNYSNSSGREKIHEKDICATNANDFYDCEHALFEILDPPKKVIKNIAHVLLNISLPHMNFLFDYEIPDYLLAEAVQGKIVTVPFSNRKIKGWIVNVSKKSDSGDKKILSIISVDSKYSVLTPSIYEFCKKISNRYVSNVSDIVKLAIPKIHMRIDKKFVVDKNVKVNFEQLYDDSILQYNNGKIFLENLKNNIPIKASLMLHPYFGAENLSWIYTIISATLHTIKIGKQVIILLPTCKQCQLLETFLKDKINPEIISMITSDQTGSVKYTNFLKVLLGQAKIVLGTQNAIFAPTNNLGLIICMDDDNPSYQSSKAPYINIRQLSIERSSMQKTALLLLGFNKSIYMRYLENLKWTLPMENSPTQARRIYPKILCTALSNDNDMTHRISSQSFEAIKDGLNHGPVLVQVGVRGYYSVLFCKNCGKKPVCYKCKHLLTMQNDSTFTCTNCGIILKNPKCKKCNASDFKITKTGDLKTASDLGKMFTSTPILVSNASNPINDPIDDRRRIIVSTHGVIPHAINGYAASIILDVDSVYSMPVFWAQTESFRRWMNVVGLTRPDGKVVIDGFIEENIAINLQTYNINKILDEILDERKELELPPCERFVSLYGEHAQIEDSIKYLTEKGFETLGLMPKSMNYSMTIVKTSIANSKNLLEEIKNYIAIRSVKHLPKIRVQVDPYELW